MSTPVRKYTLNKFLRNSVNISSPRSPGTYTPSNFNLNTIVSTNTNDESYESKTPINENRSPVKFGGVKNQKIEYNDEKINNMLVDYNEVPQNEWDSISIG